MVTEFTFTDFRCRGAIVVMFYPKIPPFNLAAEEVKACPVQRIWHVNVVEHQVVERILFVCKVSVQCSAVHFNLLQQILPLFSPLFSIFFLSFHSSSSTLLNLLFDFLLFLDLYLLNIACAFVCILISTYYFGLL